MMRRIVATGLMLAMLVGLGLGATAASASTVKPVAVSLSWVGDSSGGITLSAVTVKHGSKFSDAWSSDSGLSFSSATVPDDQGNYVATATTTLPGPGSYTITYSITMTGGGATWVGGASITITWAAGDLPPGGGGGTGI